MAKLTTIRERVHQPWTDLMLRELLPELNFVRGQEGLQLYYAHGGYFPPRAPAHAETEPEEE